MATLAISQDFLRDYAAQEKKVRNRVIELAHMFAQLTPAELSGAKGIHLESYKAAADNNARTVRISDNLRGIVLDTGDGETFVLTRILPHDEADSWMARNSFRVNEATGALEIIDSVAIDAAVNTSVVSAGVDADGVYCHRSDKEFVQLGIDRELIPALRAFDDETQLQALLGVLPQTQADALIMLTGTESVDALYAELVGSNDPIGATDDLAAAIRRPVSRHQYQVITEEAALEAMLAQPLQTWRYYLHHSQHKMAYRDRYNGPVRVTGGAGTGKTVVALHRAVYLAERAEPASAPPVLFTTYTRNLAEVIDHDLNAMTERAIADRIEVLNVDRLAHRVVADADGRSPSLLSENEQRTWWQQACDETGTDRSPEFVRAEWEHVVLAQQCASRADYFRAVRHGRGVPLNRRERADVWGAIESFTARLAANERYTHLQLASVAAAHLAGRTVKPYRHIVVDEAQDLHEAQWRLLRAAVVEGPNDMFIVGDSHQRIYDRRTTLSRVGISIRGRSHRLRINYRTTHEILRFAMVLLGEEEFDDLDGELDAQTTSTYHSFLHGDDPVLSASRTGGEQLGALSEQIGSWLADGVAEHEIGIACRQTRDVDRILSYLNERGIRAAQLSVGAQTSSGVSVGTMHRMKGLEFRYVAVAHVDDETVPMRWALADKADDAAQHRSDLLMERCLLYVACTRAREGLWVGWHGQPSRFLGGLVDP